MSFTQFLQDNPQLTREQVMAMLIQVADELEMPDKRGAAIIAGLVVSQEVGVQDNDPPNLRRFWCPANKADAESLNYLHDSIANDNRSVGYFQQQKGPNGELWWGATADEMDLHSAATTFMTRLKSAGYDASTPTSAAACGCAIQNPRDHAGYTAQTAGYWADINTLYDQVPATPPASPETPPEAEPVTETDPRLAALEAVKPDFNEYDNLTQDDDGNYNWQDRNGATVDLILGHTEESSGYDNADGLSQFLKSTIGGANPVSYHRTISKGQNDDGVTVVNCVRTGNAAWAVGNSNNRSINMCFAGSSVNWSRSEWIQNCGRSFDVFAYLAVRDAITLGWTSIPVIPGPNYNADPPGVSDHRYCSDYLKDGNNHVDMGDNVPWDLIEASINTYWAAAHAGQTPVDPEPPVPAGPTPVGPADDQIDLRWNCLGGQTLVEAVAEIRDKITGSNDRSLTGAL